MRKSDLLWNRVYCMEPPGPGTIKGGGIAIFPLERRAITRFP